MDAPTLYQRAFGEPARSVVQAPGRLELLGNHTDYNEGLVLALAIDKYIQIAVGPRKDGYIHLVTSAFPEPETFPFDRIEKNPPAAWANYVKGVLLQLRRRGVHFTGFNAAIHGTIPLGAGMSSSAALEVATALAVRRLAPFTLNELGAGPLTRRQPGDASPPLDSAEKMHLAKLCQAAESEFVGVRCGLLDQIASLFGKEGQVIQIDCRFNSISHQPLPAGVVVVVSNSGVKHELAAGEYNALRAHCEAAARALGVPALRSVNVEQLRANQTRLQPRDYECAFHVVTENQRVVFAERALREGDVDQLGQYLFQSHESSRDYFKNSCPELDLLVELARATPGCIGSRLTGGGFGGATISLVRDSAVKEFVAGMSQRYATRTGRQLESWICRVVDGAR